MFDEQVAGTPNQDVGKKVVPESDLIAVKRAAERREEELSTELSTHKSMVTELKGSLDNTHSELLKAQAGKEQLEEQIREVAGSKVNSEELQKELSATKQVVGDLETRLLDQTKAGIITQYGVGAEALAGKTLEQLGLFEEALKLVKGGKPANIDVGGGMGGTATPINVFDQCKQELAELRKK